MGTRAQQYHQDLVDTIKGKKNAQLASQFQQAKIAALPERDHPSDNELTKLKTLSMRVKAAKQNPHTINPTIRAYANQQSQIIGKFITRIGADHSSQKAGDKTGSLINRKDINVFIVDTGVTPHSDLQSLVGGANFTSLDINNYADQNGHGTHVAGIIAADDNDFGVVGVAPGARIWAIKVLAADGSGTIINIVNGLKWILENRGKKWDGYGIVNMSLGGSASPELDSAVSLLLQSGIIVVSAAGNEAINASYCSPARVPNVITVAASDSPDYNTYAGYTNWGSSVYINAPGSSIMSTYYNGSYATLSGTSMATPVVTGTIVSMIAKKNPPLSKNITFVQTIRNMLKEACSFKTITNTDGTQGINNEIFYPNNIKTTGLHVYAGSF